MKKLLNITCHGKFYIDGVPFSGVCKEVVLDTKDISTCLQNKAMVEEVLVNGRTFPLDFTNYMDKNGTPKFNIDNAPTIIEAAKHPVIETITDRKPELESKAISEEELFAAATVNTTPVVKKVEAESKVIDSKVQVKNQEKPPVGKHKK